MPESPPRPPTRRRPPRRRPLRSGFLAGVAQTLAIVVAFVGVGVVAGSLGSREPVAAAAETGAEHPPPDLYPRTRPSRTQSLRAWMDVWMDGAPDSTAEPETWLVDGFNALHVAVLRGRDRHAWWRGEERERLLAQVASFEAGEAEVVVVFDGPRPLLSGRPDGAGPRVVFAPSADDWLLRRIKEAAAPDRVALVTADRQLADRARHRGARVVSPRDFLDRCNGTPGSI